MNLLSRYDLHGLKSLCIQIKQEENGCNALIEIYWRCSQEYQAVIDCNINHPQNRLHLQNAFLSLVIFFLIPSCLLLASVLSLSTSCSL